jgi:hypothetical protein
MEMTLLMQSDKNVAMSAVNPRRSASGENVWSSSVWKEGDDSRSKLRSEGSDSSVTLEDERERERGEGKGVKKSCEPGQAFYHGNQFREHARGIPGERVTRGLLASTLFVAQRRNEYKYAPSASFLNVTGI